MNREAELRELYERVPKIKCKGFCHTSCCFIDCSTHERVRMERATGRRLETLDAAAPGGAGSKLGHDKRPLARYRCSMLTDDGRCSVYDLRPMICRLFGAGPDMLRCEWYCRPERVLSHEEALWLLSEANRIGGGGPTLGADDLRRFMADPDVAAVVKRMMGE